MEKDKDAFPQFGMMLLATSIDTITVLITQFPPLHYFLSFLHLLPHGYSVTPQVFMASNVTLSLAVVLLVKHVLPIMLLPFAKMHLVLTFPPLRS